MIKSARALVKAGLALLVLAMALMTAGCGKDGKIYGFVDSDPGSLAAVIGGFPSAFFLRVYYQIDPGTYDLYYNIYDGVHYWPSFGTYYYSYYTVEADKGSFPFVNGQDHYFELYLGYYGITKSGDVRSIQPEQGKGASPLLGTRSWTEDGLRITVTSSIVTLTPEQVAKLKITTLSKK